MPSDKRQISWLVNLGGYWRGPAAAVAGAGAKKIKQEPTILMREFPAFCRYAL